MALYAYKQSFNMNEKNYLKRIRSKKFWESFESKNLWRRHRKLTAK